MQRLRRLSGRRSAREEEGAFVIDGPTLLAEAVAAGVEVQEVFATPDAHPDALAAAARSGAVVHAVPEDVLARSVDTVTPQGVAAVATRVEVPLATAVAAVVEGGLGLVLVDVADPGNAGTLLRAAEAAGASAVLFCGRSVDPSGSKCVRASAGALFHLPVAVGGEAVEILGELRAGGVRTLATTIGEGRAYDEVDWRLPSTLVLGSEAHGLPPEVVAAADEAITIPITGRSESLNVAMAGAVLCFEAQRQRRAASP